MTHPSKVIAALFGAICIVCLCCLKEPAHAWGDESRYCHPEKQWYVWQGNRWAPDNTGEMLLRAKNIARALYQEAALHETKELRDSCAGWARKCAARSPAI